MIYSTIKTRKFASIEVEIDGSHHMSMGEFMNAVKRLSGYLDGQDFSREERNQAKQDFGEMMNDIIPF